MAVACPHCKQSISVRGVKPGRFKPKCPSCQKPFLLNVPADGGSPTVSALADAGGSSSKPVPVGEATTEQISSSEPRRAAPSEKTTDFGPGATAGDVTTDQPSAAAPNSITVNERRGPTATDIATDTERIDEPSTATPRKPTAKKTKAAGGSDPEVLGGYRIEKVLGRGGMGAVYLAHQLSLDRPVALKVMNEKFAQNAQARARFVREAFAAAQLVHHNVVQIYDIGQDAGIDFFSMEFVKGQSVGEILKEKKHLEPDEAVTLLLQAARGLQVAHDLGLVHRDVKPDNLMVNDQGIVKVADLGLVRAAGEKEEQLAAGPASFQSVMSAEVTQANVTLGTPAYMAPEQARDAASVDHRADIYSLGCTLYVLLTGRPVFQGKTIPELITKHATEKVVPPEVVVKGVPKDLSAIVQRMLAKRPEERYTDLGEVIAAFEEWLANRQGGPFQPGEAEADQLAASVRDFNNAPAAKLRRLAWLGVVGGLGIVGLLLLFMAPKVGLAAWAAALATPLAYFVLSGFRRRDHLFLQARDLAFGARVTDWLTWVAGLALLIVVFWLVGGLWYLMGALILATALAAGLHFALDGMLDQQRSPSLEAAERLLRSLRLKGLSEDALRQFVCKYAGNQWEEFYETLFGFEAKLAARKQLAEEGVKPRPRFAAWREPLLAAIAGRQKARQEARARKALRQVEEASLKAQGISQSEARQKADQMAEAMVEQAAELRKAAAAPLRAGPRPTRPRLNPLLNLKLEEWESKRKRRGLFQRLLAPVGPKMRFLLGALLVTACALWVNQNFQEAVQKLREEATRLADAPTTAPNLGGWAQWQELLTKETRSLNVATLPAWLTGWVNSFNVGFAGLVLVLSVFFRGGRPSLAVLPGAFVIVAGTMLGLPPARALATDLVPLAIGASVALVGGWLLRERR